ncbi:hypothetical protein Pelo_10379 [Pelomyxa schiedti]|nr:hypothetical protein Pelo_10379 [Pelomyxa schiedti]
MATNMGDSDAIEEDLNCGDSDFEPEISPGSSPNLYAAPQKFSLSNMPPINSKANVTADSKEESSQNYLNQEVNAQSSGSSTANLLNDDSSPSPEREVQAQPSKVTPKTLMQGMEHVSIEDNGLLPPKSNSGIGVPPERGDHSTNSNSKIGSNSGRSSASQFPKKATPQAAPRAQPTITPPTRSPVTPLKGKTPMLVPNKTSVTLKSRTPNKPSVLSQPPQLPAVKFNFTPPNGKTFGQPRIVTAGTPSSRFSSNSPRPEAHNITDNQPTQNTRTPQVKQYYSSSSVSSSYSSDSSSTGGSGSPVMDPDIIVMQSPSRRPGHPVAESHHHHRRGSHAHDKHKHKHKHKHSHHRHHAEHSCHCRTIVMKDAQTQTPPLAFLPVWVGPDNSVEVPGLHTHQQGYPMTLPTGGIPPAAWTLPIECRTSQYSEFPTPGLPPSSLPSYPPNANTFSCRDYVTSFKPSPTTSHARSLSSFVSVQPSFPRSFPSSSKAINALRRNHEASVRTAPHTTVTEPYLYPHHSENLHETFPSAHL